MFAIVDGGRRIGWDWKRNTEQSKKNLVLINTDEDDSQAGMDKNLEPRAMTVGGREDEMAMRRC